MPSGAKKRKAAKKKLQKVANNNGSHSQVGDPKSLDERISHGDGVEREENFEGVGVNYGEEGAKEVSLRDEGVSGRAVEAADDSRELKNGNKSSYSSSGGSSSSSSSDDDEVVAEEEKFAEESPEEDQHDLEASVDDSVVSVVVDELVEESFPLEELGKQAVSLPEESTTVIEIVPMENSSMSDVTELVQEGNEENVFPVVIRDSENASAPVTTRGLSQQSIYLPQPVENSWTSDVIESGLEHNVAGVLHLSHEKSEVGSVIGYSGHEKIEEKVVVPVDNSSTSVVIEPWLEQNVSEVLHLSHEKKEVGSVIADSVHERIEEQVVPVEIESSENASTPVDVTLNELSEQVADLLQGFSTVTESVHLENSSTSEVSESGLKQTVAEVLHLSHEKNEFDSVITDLVHEKIEERVIPVVTEGSGKASASVDLILRESPRCTDVKAVECCCVDGNSKESETHKCSEEEPLISGAPLPVRQTSWMSCCGLFEVFFGGSS